MPLATEKLRILSFPQRITGDQLELRILLLPTQRLLYVQDLFASQLNPGTTVSLPRFIQAHLALSVTTIQGLSAYPFSDAGVLASVGATAHTEPAGLAFPPGLPALYEGLASQFALDPTPPAIGASAPRADSDGVRKYLPQSYRQAFNFTQPRTPFAVTDDSYHCAIRRSPAPDPMFKNSSDLISWGRVIAFCLRQPQLAERVGLMFRKTLTLPSADHFVAGGWIYCSLASPLAEFDIANADLELKRYAARIPPISAPRQLFAPLLFPVVPGPTQPNGDFDTLKIETSDYDDGFAKIVHAVQPVSANLLSEAPDGIHVQKDVGVRLGWDDEQLLIWQNRQLLADPTTLGQRIDAPLGVFSYRVDVREIGGAVWESLVRQQNKATLVLAGETIAKANTPIETGVQVFPTKINADLATPYWLPSYFSQWYGASLVLPDERAAQLDASGGLADPGAYGDANIKPAPAQKGGLYEPLLPRATELKYGHEYEFRVRLADLAGGGPKVDDEEFNDAPATSSQLVFKRYVAPKQLKLEPVTPQPKPDSGTALFYEGTSFTVTRPRLGYPALLFTELDTADAFQKLLDDKDFLHTGKVGNETIKEQREVSWFDPDVDRILVVVEVKTLLMDTLASLTQRESFIPLYTTLRSFDADPTSPFALELEYRDANVIDFGNPVDYGDLGVSQAELDVGGALVLPRSRDVRITLLPVCSDKSALPAYFGFARTTIAGQAVRSGEPTQFFVREDAADERDFFRLGLESHQLQGLYLQADAPQVVNAQTFLVETVEGKALQSSTLMQRLAAQLDLGFNGLSLIGRPGQRVQFGCSHRIRHTLAPDASSLTFATQGDLVNHWLMVLSFDIQRDWTWDGLADIGVEVKRTYQFTGEGDTLRTDVVGYMPLRKTVSRLAQGTDSLAPQRGSTRIVFIDAIEPKKDATMPSTVAHPFPNTIDAGYSLTPQFIAAVAPAVAARERVLREVQLPVTTIPAQVLKVVAAGYALSPYRHDADYSETAVRERWLWLEFDQPVQDPNDTCFARVLSYAPDPLLSFPSPDQLLVKQDNPPLAIDPEPIRIITAGHGNDSAGIDAMQTMTPETAEPGVPLVKLTPVHYLLPLPPGLHAESPELFGFFNYELRVGHGEQIWSTAQGRFGHPTRLNGVQHPAPPLKCLVDRNPVGLTVTAPHAQAVFGGKNVTARPSKTELWCMLYAQVMQADGRSPRNLLLSEARLDQIESHSAAVGTFLGGRVDLPIKAFNAMRVNLDAPAVAAAHWSDSEIVALLEQFELAADTALSVLAVEMMPRYDQYIVFGPAPDTGVRPLSRDLGRFRILRSSPLTAAPAICCAGC